MTPALWELLIPAVAALCTALATWMHSQQNRARIRELEEHQAAIAETADRVGPEKRE